MKTIPRSLLAVFVLTPFLFISCANFGELNKAIVAYQYDHIRRELAEKHQAEKALKLASEPSVAVVPEIQKVGD